MGLLITDHSKPAPCANRVNSATFFTTQIDFEKAGDLLVYVDEEQVKWIEDRMSDKGYLPGNRMADAFNLLRSNDLIWSRHVRDYMLGERMPMTDLMAWNADATRMPCQMHSEYLRHLFLENDLAEGRFMVAGKPVIVVDDKFGVRICEVISQR